LPGKAVLEMTYTVSGGTLNVTYSLTPTTDLHLDMFRCCRAYCTIFGLTSPWQSRSSKVWN